MLLLWLQRGSGGGGYCFGRLIERASSVRDINTYFMILGFGRVIITCTSLATDYMYMYVLHI